MISMNSLKLLDQFPFEFYDSTFTAILASDRKLYVPLHDMCQSLGIQTNGQLRRIRDHEAIAPALVPLVITRAYQDEDAQSREMWCLRLDRLPYWLGTLQPSRIQDADKRVRVVRFQLEFADVAWAAFRSQILPADMLAELDATLPPGQQAYLQTMDEAAALRQGVAQQGQRLETLEQRVAALEARVVGTDYINTAQMKEYTDMVGILAHLLRQKGKGNEATVHAEMKRQFQVPSYQLIPEASFDQVKRSLRDWYRRLAGPDAAIPALFEQPSQKRLL
jgi:hypothetical protein